MLRKFLVCLTALFAIGFQPQAKAALYLWNQTVGNSVIAGEHTFQVCLLYPVGITYENAIAWFDWASHDCQWWYPDWPYYEQVIEDHNYTPGVPGQDTLLGNAAYFPYSCPSFIATEGFARVRWREYGSTDAAWLNVGGWYECNGGGYEW